MSECHYDVRPGMCVRPGNCRNVRAGAVDECLELAQLRGISLVYGPGARGTVPASLERRAAGLVSERLGWIRTGTPVSQQSERTGQSAAVGRQLVAEPERPLGIGARLQDSLAFEALEAIRQDVGGYPRQAGLEVVEAARTDE